MQLASSFQDIKALSMHRVNPMTFHKISVLRTTNLRSGVLFFCIFCFIYFDFCGAQTRKNRKEKGTPDFRLPSYGNPPLTLRMALRRILSCGPAIFHSLSKWKVQLSLCNDPNATRVIWFMSITIWSEGLSHVWNPKILTEKKKSEWQVSC